MIDSLFDVEPGPAIGDIVVALTDRVTELSGTLVDQAGLPAPELFVDGFPVDAAHWPESWRRMVEPASRRAEGGAGYPAGAVR